MKFIIYDRRTSFGLAKCVALTMFGKFLHEITQLCEWFNPIQLGTVDERIKLTRMFTGSLIAYKQIVLASDSWVLHRSFSGMVIVR